MGLDTLIALMFMAVFFIALLALGVSKLIERVWGVSEHVPEVERLHHQAGNYTAPAADPPAPPTEAPGALPPAIRALLTDRTREAGILALVAAGWSGTEIRDFIKGDNERIGKEVRAAQEQLGIVPAPRRLPVYKGRPNERSLELAAAPLPKREPLP